MAARARPHHRDHDPEQLSADFGCPRSRLAECQQRAGEGERQGEDRVLELDHVEREAEAFPEHREVTDRYHFSSCGIMLLSQA